jgi:hypothetical protein
MKILDYNKILTRANQLYAQAKQEKGWDNHGRPPKIESDQVKTVLRALIEEFNWGK